MIFGQAPAYDPNNKQSVAFKPRITTYSVSHKYSDRSESHELYYNFSLAVAHYDKIKANAYGLEEVTLRQRGFVVSGYKAPHTKGLK